MSFKIPNLAAAGFPFQADPDVGDMDIIVAGFLKTGVISGCGVTAQGAPDMTVAVAAGSIMVAGKVVAVTGGNVTITAANATNPRFDLIVVDNAGAKSAVAGAPTGAPSEPAFPSIPANSVVLAAVYVPNADGAINTNQIVDKRIMLSDPVKAFSRGKMATATMLNIPGIPTTATSTLLLNAARRYYNPFIIGQETTVDQLLVEVSAAAAVAGKVGRIGIYKADADWQPAGLIYDTGTFAVDAVAVKTSAVTLTYAPGRYLTAMQSDGAPTLRTHPSGSFPIGIDPAMGNNSSIAELRKDIAFAAYDDPGAAWDAIAKAGAGMQNLVLQRISGVNY